MTELQQALIDRIHAYFEARFDGPTSEELRKDFRYRSEASVQRCLEGLAAAGQLSLVRNRWRLKGPDVQLHFPLAGDERRPAILPPR